MEIALRALLASSAAIASLIPDLNRQITWGILPQGTPLPAIVLNVISGQDDSIHQQGTGGLWRFRVQIDCYGDTYLPAVTLANAVTDTLHGYSAADFRLILLDNRRDHHETGAADRPYRIGLDFIINYRRG